MVLHRVHPPEDGFEATMESWPGALAIAALLVWFEFFHHNRRVWKYPHEAFRKIALAEKENKKKEQS